MAKVNLEIHLKSGAILDLVLQEAKLETVGGRIERFSWTAWPDEPRLRHIDLDQIAAVIEK